MTNERDAGQSEAVFEAPTALVPLVLGGGGGSVSVLVL